jgi:hypothetical protein
LFDHTDHGDVNFLEEFPEIDDLQYFPAFYFGYQGTQAHYFEDLWLKQFESLMSEYG